MLCVWELRYYVPDVCAALVVLNGTIAPSHLRRRSFDSSASSFAYDAHVIRFFPTSLWLLDPGGAGGRGRQRHRRKPHERLHHIHSIVHSPSHLILTFN